MANYNVLYLSSEITPFAKVGGLADVANALPRFLKEKDHDIRVLIPKYKMIRDRKFNLREVIRLREIEVPLGKETITVSVKSGFIPESKVQAYFIEYKPLFDRPDVYIDPKTGKGWPDNHLRFALFARAAFEVLKVLYWQPDLIHVNDWPAALTPFYLKTVYRDDPFFRDIRTVLSIHNLAYQGEFEPEVLAEISADSIPFDEKHPAWHNGKVNFLKAGILTADLVTTVSPRYRDEILENKEIGAGLGETLASLGDRFVGVLNGIDDITWDPETDEFLAKNYSAEDIEGKAANRTALIEELQLECGEETLLIGMISRLVKYQKGYELLAEAIKGIMELDVAIVVLGEGDPDIVKLLEKAAKEYPGRFKLVNRFDPALAHRIEAGADAFLMPSRFEPCGLNQMYSMHYGTPPIVHATGGLADTVVDFDPVKKQGSGFVFTEFTPEALTEAIKRAIQLFHDKKNWKVLVKNCMARDFSWSTAVDRFTEVLDATFDDKQAKVKATAG